MPDPLEEYVEAEIGELLNLRFTAGSGNALGDGDLKPRARDIHADIQFGVECKRRTTTKAHTVPWSEYQKAKKQVEKGGNTLLFVTQNAARHRMVHMDFADFKQLLLILMER